VLWVWCVYFVEVLQRVIDMVCVLCGGVEACYGYGACTVWWSGSVILVWSVYCVGVWQRVICMVRVLCGGVASCHKYGA